MDPFAHLPSAQPELLETSPQKGLSGHGGSSGLSLTEARLLRAYWRDPRGGDYYRSLVRAMRECRNCQEWPKARLEQEYALRFARTQELGAMLDGDDDALRARNWDGPKYWQMHLRHRSWMGRCDGMLEAMLNRRDGSG